jgi:V-type H+-transporting ATPase subunit D
LGRGGTQLQKLKRNYNEAIKNLVELATLQTSFIILDDVIKITNRRVNAIEHGMLKISVIRINLRCFFLVIIPKITRTINYIISELDEMEREEFYRYIKKTLNLNKFSFVI